MICVTFLGWWVFIRDPFKVDESFYHHDQFQFTADIDGKPIPAKIGLGESLPIRFRCPVPEGITKTSKYEGHLIIVTPGTYRDPVGTSAHQQIHGGAGVSLTLGSPSGVVDVTPPYPKKDDNVLQFSSLLSGKNLEKVKSGVPLEMHLWLYPMNSLPNNRIQVSEEGVWVFRHSFEFVNDSPAS